MKKVILIVAASVLILSMLAGDGLAGWLLLTQHRGANVATTAGAVHSVQKPHGTLHFVQLDKFVVTLPPAKADADANANGPSYAQVGLSFASYDKAALKAFQAVQPMIKAAIISSIMAHADKVATGSSAARKEIIASALTAANTIVTQQNPKVGPQPFAGAFLTDFLLQ